MITIATVNVGNYRGMGARYVNALFNGCARHLTVPFRFACLTDDASGLHCAVEPRTIPGGIEGWYNKLALFRPHAFEDGERVFYIDLDTVILGNIDDIVSFDGPFAMLNHPHSPSLRRSGIMAWEAGRYTYLWNAWMEQGRPISPGGDQVRIAKQVPAALAFQDMFPGRILSFKAECARDRTPTRSARAAWWKALKAQYFHAPYPECASIVYFHGRPKPDNCWTPWVREAWRG
jgi:hypothetical protein